MLCEEAGQLLDIYIDRELDAAQVDAVEAHIAGCRACQKQQADALALRSLIREHAPRYAAPERLRRRIRASMRPAPARGWLGGWEPSGWLQFGGTFAAAVLLSSLLTYYSLVPSRTDAIVDEVVATHVRALITNRMTDVASSDQHTVKPWFNGKLDFSPPVTDWARQGFPLVGGRLDYLDGRPIAALLYRRRQHWISVFIWPVSGDPGAGLQRYAERGYGITRWSAGGLTYFVVSDVASNEQDQLVTLLRSAQQD
jgi:anti-sigma factor RsiW